MIYKGVEYRSFVHKEDKCTKSFHFHHNFIDVKLTHFEAKVICEYCKLTLCWINDDWYLKESNNGV